jgi:hypothetical protein
MPVSYCPPTPLTKEGDLVAGFKFRNHKADQDPETDWSEFIEATRLSKVAGDNRWLSSTERIAHRELWEPSVWPFPAQRWYMREYHRLTIDATLDVNGTTLHISVKLETTYPTHADAVPRVYTTIYENTDHLEIDVNANWRKQQYAPLIDPAHVAECGITLAPIGPPNKVKH